MNYSDDGLVFIECCSLDITVEELRLNVTFMLSMIVFFRITAC